jgi:3-hydroxyacyl-CoA dehydrogenase/enoyl-CoA hydratase/3-hydroxybutyryl-CoA epimerase
MNVFSNAAIHELGEFSRWLAASSVRGVVIRSGKDSAFCVGADLGELGSAYDMIMQSPPRARFDVAFDHFFPLSAAIRALETAGKPVAVAIAGLALGGGCELAMGAHFRVLVDDPKAALGLPESLVGLLPGAGGTQRLPRLVGIEHALPILIRGTRLSGRAALEAGLVDALAKPGEEIELAEQWLLSHNSALQPWDREEWKSPPPGEINAVLAPVRRRILQETLGHYPAPLAILDCVEFGLVQCFDGAIRSEMAIFSHLIQRTEPRNMIQTLFTGRTEYERLARKSDAASADFVLPIVDLVRRSVSADAEATAALAAAGFAVTGAAAVDPVRDRALPGLWIDAADTDPRKATVLAVLQHITTGIKPWRERLTRDQQRIADYAAVKEAGYPAYLGGPFAFAARERG